MGKVLGIDTGGTYTDSVVLDSDTGKVLSRSKALTTRQNLAVGIGESLKGLGCLKDICSVSLSTTLATNSVVEGKRCRVGLITIGREINDPQGVSEYRYVEGEFDLRGNTVVELEAEQAKKVLKSFKGKVDVLAVAGYLSSRYPDHENCVRSLADEILGIPVVCGHDLTSKLGFEQRINTAVINAGLIPVIIELIDAVKRTLSELGVDAPLMIVKGDGSVMNAETASKRPVETILSGPASSLNSAMVHSKTEDAIIVDMGGTTTDIGLIRGGFIHTLDDGAVISGMRTRVRAADVSTYGIGGDSRIVFSVIGKTLSPTREIPLCIASSRWPVLAQSIEDDPSVFEFFIRTSKTDISGLSDIKKRAVSSFGMIPLSMEVLEDISDECDIDDITSELESEGFLTRIGITPTDILAAEGSYREYGTDTSFEVASFLADIYSQTFMEFITELKNMVFVKVSSCIVDHINRLSSEQENFFDRTMISTDESLSSFDIAKFLQDAPIVGIGAPADVWIRGAAERLGREFIITEDHDVANAIGAVSSNVTEYVEIAVRAMPNDFSEDPACKVFSGEDSRSFVKMSEAIDFAIGEGERIASSRAEGSGACGISLDHRIDRNYIDCPWEKKKLIRGADIVVRASGKSI